MAASIAGQKCRVSIGCERMKPPSVPTSLCARRTCWAGMRKDPLRYLRDANRVNNSAGKPSNVWSGSPNANNSNNAWNVHFNNGNANNNNRNNNKFVRLVRSGEC